MAFKVTIKKNADGSITRSVNGANSDQASNITTSKGTTVQTEIESITPYVKVTQAQYDALKSAGTLAKNTNYIITDKPYSADDVLDLATIKSRGASGTLKASDVASANCGYALNNEISALKETTKTLLGRFSTLSSNWTQSTIENITNYNYLLISIGVSTRNCSINPIVMSIDIAKTYNNGNDFISIYADDGIQAYLYIESDTSIRWQITNATYPLLVYGVK